MSAYRIPLVIAAAVLVIAAASAWLVLRPADLPAGFASGNGRLEAKEMDVASKYAGRVVDILVDEGELVQPGHIVARMDAVELEASLRQSQARTRQAQAALTESAAQVDLRESECVLAGKELGRAEKLFAQGHVAEERVDIRRTQKETADAACAAAKAHMANMRETVAAARAQADRIQAQLDETVLRAPYLSRVQYRLAEPGEVLPAGGKVATLLNLTDVYMTIFLPTAEAGRTAVGADARIVLDALPHYVIPATVSFVAPEAQFTPRAVETRTEREKLMFRIKVQIDPELLLAHIEQVKAGVPGVAYVRLDDTAVWPDHLAARVPE